MHLARASWRQSRLDTNAGFLAKEVGPKGLAIEEISYPAVKQARPESVRIATKTLLFFRLRSPDSMHIMGWHRIKITGITKLGDKTMRAITQADIVCDKARLFAKSAEHAAKQECDATLKDLALRLAQTRIMELEEQLAQMSKLAHEDPLTGLLNRRGCEVAFARIVPKRPPPNAPVRGPARCRQF